jgi:hypothetical protein
VFYVWVCVTAEGWEKGVIYSCMVLLAYPAKISRPKEGFHCICTLLVLFLNKIETQGQRRIGHFDRQASIGVSGFCWWIKNVFGLVSPN